VRRYFQPEAPLPAANGLDWRQVLELADGHAVMPFLQRGITESDGAPADVLAELRRLIRATTEYDLTLNAELVGLLIALEREGIQNVTLKGPILRLLLYGNAGLRGSTDLDLLFHARDVGRVRKLLEERGYLLRSPLHWHGETACLRNRESQLSFARPGDDLRVDVHWRLLPGYFPPSFEEHEAWRGLRKIPIAGAFGWSLPPEKLVLFLSAHGMKHLWQRLGWICDIARVVQVEQVDWAEVLKQAEATDTTRIVLLGLFLAQELLGVKVPAALQDRVRTDTKIPVLARAVLKRIREGRFEMAGAIETAQFSSHGFQRMSHRVRLVAAIFFGPTDAEYKLLQLPPFLYWLYYLLRPLRLAVKYAF